MSAAGSEPGERPSGVLDVVAAAERTALAWERTGFGLVGVGALLVHEGRSRAEAAQLAVGVAVMVLGATTSVVVAPRRYRGIAAQVRAGHTPVLRRTTALLAAVVVLVAATSVVLLRA